jgi:exoribonuclease R
MERYSHTNICGEGRNVFYAHASSPLRRMVDIYNQLCLIQSLGGSGEEMVEEMQKGFKRWMEVSVEEINAQNRKIRRIQTECEMLADFFSEEKVGASELYDGVVVDLDASKGYWVFLEQWKRLVYVETQDTDAEIRERGQIGKYQIFLFEEEEKAHKKIICRRCVQI